ncbi:MAG: hypothetical protein ACRDHW_09845, partial [Ktedonobacteraceae bacterium]
TSTTVVFIPYLSSQQEVHHTMPSGSDSFLPMLTRPERSFFSAVAHKLASIPFRTSYLENNGLDCFVRSA